MASNTGKRSRKGAVKHRTQTYNPRLGSWIKRESGSGRFIAMKKGSEPFKGVKVERAARVIVFPKAMSGKSVMPVEGDLLPAA
jgi:hypothetical protein